MLQIILAAILSVVFILSENISEHAEKHHKKLLSLSAGMFTAIIFMEIFPFISQGAQVAGDVIFVGMLASFTIYHLVEEHTYQHTRGLKRRKEINSFHIIGFFVENFINGFVLATFLLLGISPLIFLPFLLVVVSISLSLKHLDDRFNLGPSKYFLSLSVLFGAIVATFLSFSVLQIYIMLSLITGFLLYFVVRDMISKDSSGNPKYFLAGVIVVALLLELIKLV